MGVLVEVDVGVWVGVGVGVLVGVAVREGVGEGVPVGVDVGVLVEVDVSVWVGVGVEEGEGVWVYVGVGVGVFVGVEVSVGVGLAHEFGGDALLRGFGAPAAKSPALSSVSVQPPAARSAAVVLLKFAVGPEPSKLFAALPYPTKSRMSGLGKQSFGSAPQSNSFS